MNDPRDNPGGRAARDDVTGPPSPRRNSGNEDLRRSGSAHAAAPTHRGGSPRRRGRGTSGSRAYSDTTGGTPTRRGRRVLRKVAIGMTALALVAGGAGFWLYQHLNGNISSVAIDGGGKEKEDAAGRTPLNLLVIGADSRSSAADCKLGGACKDVTGHGHADVEMVVHVSADRSNATVMSIPRDTMVDVPSCHDPDGQNSTSGFHGMVNSALAYGASCQVDTVHKLTGIPIDHFLMVDFSGVVSMSDAVGGVPVCVDDNVYDTESHLKLAKGTHTLKGKGALEFVRTRYGFGDGGDRGRAMAQHMFLGSMIREFHSAGTLTDPAKVYSLADAATKALTVDNGLDSVKKLTGLATEVNKVPAKRITFTTMQTAPDPTDQNRLVPGPGARTLFTSIAGDQSLSGAGGSGGAGSGSGSGAVPASRIAVTVRNGTDLPGRAATVAGALTDKGFSRQTTTDNAPAPATATTLTYPAGHQPEARTAAKALGLPAAHLKQGSGTGLTLVIGGDWTSGSVYPGGTATTPPADPHAALSEADSQTADRKGACAKVGSYKTVNLNGVPMTPSQAYADARDVPDSAH